jgi:DNA-binding CsgD family transcriptional regulator
MVEEQRFKDIYEADLAYLRGDFERTLACYRKIGNDDAARLRACPLAIAAAISLGDYQTYSEIDATLKRINQTNTDKQVKAIAECTLATVAVSVVTPQLAPDWLKNGDLSNIPPIVRLDVIYLRIKYFQRIGQFETMLAVAQTAISLCISDVGIKWHDVYIHLMCAIACHALERKEEARHWLVLAMQRALPHHFITPFTENVTALGGLIEQCLQQEFPNYYNVVIDQWKRTWKNRVSFHNQFTKKNITLILSLQEYHLATLVAQRIPYTKIAKQYHISVGRLKNIMQDVYAKLFITNRNELAKYIL